MDLHIIITGNPVDGLAFCGPFASVDDAIHYADTVHHGDEWWIAELTPVPDGFTDEEEEED